MVRSSGAESSSVAASKAVPMPSRAAQRLIEAVQSRAKTGWPSCQSRPSRSRKSHNLPSSPICCPASIWGETSRRVFMPYSVSNTINPWVRDTCAAAAKIGSVKARSITGTKRRGGGCGGAHDDGAGERRGGPGEHGTAGEG